MNEILAYLEQLTYPEELSAEYREIEKKLDPFYNAIREQFSLKFLDDFHYTQSDAIKWERQEAFSRGFRLGAKLILALSGPSAPGIHHRS